MKPPREKVKKKTYDYVSLNFKLTPKEALEFKEKAKLYAGGKLTTLLRVALETYAPRKI